jgi:Glycosyl hydrolase family 12
VAAHRKSRKRIPLAVVLCLLVAAAFGGYALAGGHASAGGYAPAGSPAPETVNLANAAGPSGRGVTVYACLASGKLARVSVARVPKCPAKSASVRWAAQSGPASSPRVSSSSPPSSPPNPDPATTSPSPVRTTISPSPTQTSAPPASWAWCSSAPFGEWSTPDGRFDLYNNEWNTSGDPGPQTICGNSESDWQVTSTQAAGNTAVLTYPSVQLNYNGGNGYPLSQFSSMTSSYAEDMNAVSGTDAEAAYDIWLNGLNKEVMIWVDNHGQTPGGTEVATTTFSGATWDLYESSDRSYMAFVRQGNASSGTVDLLAALHYLKARGDLAASDVLWQVNFGWEICSTAGALETFTISNYSLTSAPSS